MTFRTTTALTAAGLAALAFAAPAAAETRSACEGSLDVRYGPNTSGVAAGGDAEGAGTMRCVGPMGAGFALGHPAPLFIEQPASWSGICQLGELSLPISTRQRTLFGVAHLNGLLSVRRAAAGWTIEGTGEVDGTNLLSTSEPEPVRIVGTAAAVSIDPCAGDKVQLSFAVVPDDEASDPAPDVDERACAVLQRGTAGADRLLGTAAGDSLDGRGGADRLRSLGGEDCLAGGSGRDRLAAGAGDDHVDAADGARDRVRCGSGRDEVTADRRDRLSGCERVHRI